MSTPDVNILRFIVPRLVPVAKGEPILGLEIIQGPFTGVVFSYKAFHVKNEVGPDGMIPTTFETTVHESPVDFVATEAFDHFCAEVLVAWLHHISVTNYNQLIFSDPQGVH